MRSGIGCAAALLGMMGIVTDAAASENAAGVAEKRGLSPIVLQVSPIITSAEDALKLAAAGVKTITPAIVRKIESEFFCAASQNQSYIESGEAYLGGMSPGFAVVNTLKVKYGIVAKGEVKTVVTQPPSHGRVYIVGQDNQSFPATPTEEFQYTPDKDFLGEDRVVFEVTVNGQKFRLNYVVRVVHGGFNDACEPEGDYDRGVLEPEVHITLEGAVPLINENTSADMTARDSWYSAASLNAFLASFGFGAVAVAPLDGGALAQTTGTTITLDTNAAGYNWFIDTTPGVNEEYLPTADANVWQAKKKGSGSN